MENNEKYLNSEPIRKEEKYLNPEPIRKEEKYLNPEPIRKEEKYLNPERPIDPRTNLGKGMGFKSVDGKEWETFESAMAYNEELYKIMYPKIEKADDLQGGMRR